MPGANDHVEEYLSYYSRLSNGPGFAVLVSGPWGCGKTHLIKRLLEQWANKPGFPKYIYVSLYGISDTKQIDDAFFQQLHPVLGSKGMRIAGAVLKGILRTTIKIDLHEIGKSDAAVSSQIPDLSLPEYLTNVGDRLLIFDDLERCKLPLSDALGYINSFVEHDDCKAIIVANEEEITDQEAYRVAKEKLIGKTFEVVPDLGSAFTYFADAMSDPAATCYRKHVDVVTAVFRESETNNLRILKQTMIEFERVFNVLSDAHREHEAAAVDLLRLVFSLNFELRKGRLSVEAVAELDPLRALISGGDSAITLLRKRYPETDFRQTLLDYPLIARTLGKGIVEGEVIRSALDRHHYFAPPGAEPAWRILWHSSLRSDAEVATALEKVEEQFTARQFVLDGEIIHVAGLRLWLAKIGAIPKTVEEVVSETKSYIDELYRAGKLKETGDDRRYWWSLSHGWEGLSFYEQGTPEPSRCPQTPSRSKGQAFRRLSSR